MNRQEVIGLVLVVMSSLFLGLLLGLGIGGAKASVSANSANSADSRYAPLPPDADTTRISLYCQNAVPPWTYYCTEERKRRKP